MIINRKISFCKDYYNESFSAIDQDCLDFESRGLSFEVSYDTIKHEIVKVTPIYSLYGMPYDQKADIIKKIDNLFHRKDAELKTAIVYDNHNVKLNIEQISRGSSRIDMCNTTIKDETMQPIKIHLNEEKAEYINDVDELIYKEDAEIHGEIYMLLYSDTKIVFQIVKEGSIHFDLNFTTGEMNATDDLKYETIIFDLLDYKERIKIYDENEEQMKLLKKNIYAIIKKASCSVKISDYWRNDNTKKSMMDSYLNSVCNNRKLQTVLWDLYKEKVSVEFAEILYKAGLKEVVIHVSNGRYIYVLNTKGKNVEEILQLPKSGVKFLKENIDKLVSYSSQNFSLDHFDLQCLRNVCSIKNKNINDIVKIINELNDLDEEIPYDEYVDPTRTTYSSDNIKILANPDILSKLIELNYTKNLRNLVLYLKQELPARQGINERREIFNSFIQYINTYNSATKDGFVKYPDSIKKEIDLNTKKINILSIIEKNKVMELLKEQKEIIFGGFKTDKYIIVPLITQDMLTNESDRMNNCVRTYSNTLTSVTQVCCSIRDIETNKSLCTIELRNGKYISAPKIYEDLKSKEYDLYIESFSLYQIKAPHNDTPEPKFRNLVNSEYIPYINQKIINLKNGAIAKEI